MGGEPLVAVNLLGWPRDKLPAELAAEVLRGGLDVGRAAPRQRAHHPVARQPRTRAAPGVPSLCEADERFRWTLYGLMMPC